MSRDPSRVGPSYSRLPNERVGNLLAILLASTVAVAFVVTVVVRTSHQSESSTRLAAAQANTGVSAGDQSTSAPPAGAPPTSLPSTGTAPSQIANPPVLPALRTSTGSDAGQPTPAQSGSAEPIPAQSDPTRSVANQTAGAPTAAQPSATTPSTSPPASDHPASGGPGITPADPAPSDSTATDPPPIAPTQTYSGPGGITVSVGAGWTPDLSAGGGVSDYVEPLGVDELTAAFFRIGVENPTPAATISAEADASIAALKAADPAVEIVSESFGTFLGTDSVDIEFSNYHNSLGLVRHARERLWIAGGATYILMFDTPEQSWDPALEFFNSLAATAQIAQGQ